MVRTKFPDKPRHKAGRKGYYKKELLREVFNYTCLGATDQQLADCLNVDINTIDNWKRTKPEFRQIVEKGKTEADALVVKSLFHASIGYSHKETIYFQHQGKILSQETIKHYPPNPTAMIFWLKNRRRAEWADVNEVHMKHSGQIQFKKVEDIPIDTLTPEEQELVFQLNLKQLTDGTHRN